MSSRPVSALLRHQSCVVLPAQASTYEVAQTLKQHHISAVLIVDRHHRLLGICTERDLVFGVMAAGRDPQKTMVEAIMTHHPQTVTADKPFCHALHLMYEGGFRHVPVVDSEGRPIGMLSARDALDMEALQFGQDLVRREEITVML